MGEEPLGSAKLLSGGEGEKLLGLTDSLSLPLPAAEIAQINELINLDKRHVIRMLEIDRQDPLFPPVQNPEGSS